MIKDSILTPKITIFTRTQMFQDKLVKHQSNPEYVSQPISRVSARHDTIDFEKASQNGGGLYPIPGSDERMFYIEKGEFLCTEEIERKYRKAYKNSLAVRSVINGLAVSATTTLEFLLKLSIFGLSLKSHESGNSRVAQGDPPIIVVQGISGIRNLVNAKIPLGAVLFFNLDDLSLSRPPRPYRHLEFRTVLSVCEFSPAQVDYFTVTFLKQVLRIFIHDFLLYLLSTRGTPLMYADTSADLEFDENAMELEFDETGVDPADQEDEEEVDLTAFEGDLTAEQLEFLEKVDHLFETGNYTFTPEQDVDLEGLTRRDVLEALLSLLKKKFPSKQYHSVDFVKGKLDLLHIMETHRVQPTTENFDDWDTEWDDNSSGQGRPPPPIPTTAIQQAPSTPQLSGTDPQTLTLPPVPTAFLPGQGGSVTRTTQSGLNGGANKRSGMTTSPDFSKRVRAAKNPNPTLTSRAIAKLLSRKSMQSSVRARQFGIPTPVTRMAKGMAGPIAPPIPPPVPSSVASSVSSSLPPYPGPFPPPPPPSPPPGYPSLVTAASPASSPSPASPSRVPAPPVPPSRVPAPPASSRVPVPPASSRVPASSKKSKSTVPAAPTAPSYGLSDRNFQAALQTLLGNIYRELGSAPRGIGFTELADDIFSRVFVPEVLVETLYPLFANSACDLINARNPCVAVSSSKTGGRTEVAFNPILQQLFRF